MQNTTSEMTAKLSVFAALVQVHQQAQLRADKLDCEANLTNAQTSVKIGRKYANVDIGNSGRFMVEIETGAIFGIKGYGKVHRGHQYGTLDTIRDYDWGHYYPLKSGQQGFVIRDNSVADPSRSMVKPENKIVAADAATKNAPKFEVGDGATWTIYTDSHAGHIIEVSKDGKTVKWQAAKATLLNGANSNESDKLKFSPGGFVGHTEGVQRYSYEKNPQGEIQTFTLRNNGRWVLAGHGQRQRGNGLTPGMREHYDYNF